MRSATVVLPVPGLPVKHMCSVGDVGRQAHALADALDQQQRRDLADAGLDRREADQLAVELIEHLGRCRPRRDSSAQVRPGSDAVGIALGAVASATARRERRVMSPP